MAFIASAFFGGAAKRASEILDEEREEAIKTADKSIELFTRLGLPKAVERRSERRKKEKMYDALDKLKFSGDQIAVIMKEGGGQKILDTVAERGKVIENYQINPAEVVTFNDPGYKTHGYDKAKVIELVMGKVDSGIPAAEAIQQVTGKATGGGLTEILGGNNQNIISQRMSNTASAAGVSMNELMALSSGNISYDDIAVEGQINLFDARAAAIASKDYYNSQQATKILNSFGSDITGAKSGQTDAQGNMYFQHTENTMRLKIAQETDRILKKYQEKEERQGRPLQQADIVAMKEEMSNWAIANGIHINPPESQGALVENGNDPLPTDQVAGKSIGQLERMLYDELRPQQGNKIDNKVAQAIAKQIAEAMIARSKEKGTNLLPEQVYKKVQQILKGYGYVDVPEGAIQSPDGNITVVKNKS